MISFVIPCAIFAAACIAMERLESHRRRARQGTTWDGSTVRRHRDTGEHRVVPAPGAAPAVAVARPWPLRQTPLDTDWLKDVPVVVPRRFIGRVAVELPRVADDVATYLRDAAEWQAAMRLDPLLRELVAA